MRHHDLTILALGVVAVCGVWFAAPVDAAEPSEAKQRVSTEIDGPRQLTLMDRDRRRMLVYRPGGASFKPYIKELHTPAGIQILRDSPPDHVHHRGAMFGLFVDGVDFWTEREVSGRQERVALNWASAGANDGRGLSGWTEKLHWIGPGASKPLAVETRSIFSTDGAADARLVDWRSRLEPGPQREVITLTGTHYDGLGLRFVASMDGSGEFLYADGEPGPVVRGAERVTRTRWAAYTAPVDGKPVTVALFGDPDNPRAPAGMFTMPRPFAYLSATPNVWKKPMQVKRGEPVELHYAIALWDGKAPRAAIDRLYQQWLQSTAE